MNATSEVPTNAPDSLGRETFMFLSEDHTFVTFKPEYDSPPANFSIVGLS